MLQFLVLGLIPGTNIQIDFNQIIDVLTVGAIVVAYHRSRLRHTEGN